MRPKLTVSNRYVYDPEWSRKQEQTMRNSFKRGGWFYAVLGLATGLAPFLLLKAMKVI